MYWSWEDGSYFAQDENIDSKLEDTMIEMENQNFNNPNAQPQTVGRVYLDDLLQE
jgi:hypothetical protein